MIKRFTLLLLCVVMWSLCRSPAVPFTPAMERAKLPFLVSQTPLRASLYVPPLGRNGPLAPPMLGSVSTALMDPEESAQQSAETELDEPRVFATALSIRTPAKDFITLAQYGAQEALLLEGAGEPGATVEVTVNNDEDIAPITVPVKRDGSWSARFDEKDLPEGEIALNARYAGTGAQETITWRSRFLRSTPRLYLPAYIAAGMPSVAGRMMGDGKLMAQVNGRQVTCLLSTNGSFVVPGTAQLPAGTEVVLTAADALGNTTCAVCMVAKPSAMVLQQRLDAVQMAYLAPDAYDSSVQVQEKDDANSFFPPSVMQSPVLDAYATLEGLTLAEIDEQMPQPLLDDDARRRVRDMRRQMVLPLNLDVVGNEGMQIPLLAHGYRVGTFWIDAATQTDPLSGMPRDGYVFSLELICGELMGKAQLQVVHSAQKLDILKTQGWVPLDVGDSTFYAFDQFAEVDGLALIYASVPLRFEATQLQPAYRAQEDLARWRDLLARMQVTDWLPPKAAALPE